MGAFSLFLFEILCLSFLYYFVICVSYEPLSTWTERIWRYSVGIAYLFLLYFELFLLFTLLQLFPISSPFAFLQPAPSALRSSLVVICVHGWA